jgi:hypothetical protein
MINMSKETKGVDPYAKLIILLVVVLTGVSVGVFVVNSPIQEATVRYSDAIEDLSTMANYIESDIQNLLQDDGVKLDTAYGYLQDLYVLNDLYDSMEDYNILHPDNYTQQDFDAVLMEFEAMLRQLIINVQGTWVYQYITNDLGATYYNNYTYRGHDYFIIRNNWYSTSEPIHPDIKDYINASFTLSGDPVQLLEIDMKAWIENLYSNISILQFTPYQTGVNYVGSPGFPVQTTVNKSLFDVTALTSRYVILNAKIGEIINYLDNTLITLATSAVLLGFSVSFSKKKYRMLMFVIGIVVFLLSVVYLFSTLSQYNGILESEALYITFYGS